MPKRPADVGDLADRERDQLWVGKRLRIIGAGARVGCFREVLRIGGIDEAHFDPLVLQRVGEEIPGPAIEIGRGDDIVAHLGEVLQGEGRGRLPARQSQRRDPAFERRDALFEHIVGRVHDAGVDVAELLQRKQVGGVLGALELVRGRLIDRHGDRAGGRIGAPASVQRKGFGFQRHGKALPGLASFLPRGGRIDARHAGALLYMSRLPVFVYSILNRWNKPDFSLAPVVPQGPVELSTYRSRAMLFAFCVEARRPSLTGPGRPCHPDSGARVRVQ